jgi:hypothetical protein
MEHSPIVLSRPVGSDGGGGGYHRGKVVAGISQHLQRPVGRDTSRRDGKINERSGLYLDALMSGDIKSILGEKTAKKFKTTDEELMKVLGEDRSSGAYKTLATDIDAVFEGQYGLNKIDKRLGDDYVALASLNIEKAVLNENVVMNESNLNKRVNELHNEMMDARKQAIDKSLKKPR